MIHVLRLTTGLSPRVNPLSSYGMHRDHQRWYSHRLNRDMGVAVYGNYGAPILAFPTSMGDEHGAGRSGHDPHPQPIHRARANPHLLHQRRAERFVRKQGSAPFHRSWMQAQYDAYVANEVFPFIDSAVPDARHRRSPRWAHRSALITRPTLSSSIPIT